MTVYLWLRRLPNKLLIRSPQIVKWRHEATQEVDPARAVNNLTADLRPDGAAFGVRRSSRVVASPNTGRISEKLVTSPNQSKIMTPKTKNVKIAKVTPKSAIALTPPAANLINRQEPEGIEANTSSSCKSQAYSRGKV
jgi:hypothetical protein